MASLYPEKDWELSAILEVWNPPSASGNVPPSASSSSPSTFSFQWISLYLIPISGIRFAPNSHCFQELAFTLLLYSWSIAWTRQLHQDSQKEVKRIHNFRIKKKDAYEIFLQQKGIAALIPTRLNKSNEQERRADWILTRFLFKAGMRSKRIESWIP